MFDRLVVRPQLSTTEYVTKEVHEHRAPTDASIRLLREMETAARSQVDEAIRVGDTSFECVAHLQRLVESDAWMLRAVFSLNGRKMSVEVTSDRDMTPAAFVAKLRAAVAEKIAAEILNPAMARLDIHQWRNFR